METDTIAALYDTLQDLSYIYHPDRIGYKDVVLWTGAGFSMEWDTGLPSGNTIFDIPEFGDSNIRYYLKTINGFSETYSDYDNIKMAMYKLQVQRDFPELQNTYVDKQLSLMLQQEVIRNVYKKISPHLWNTTKSLRKQKISGFMEYLASQLTYNGGKVTGYRLNILSTNYDFCIENAFKDVVLQDDDEKLYLYRGFTPASYNGICDPVIQTSSDPHNTLIKLNGGFEIIRNGEQYCIETRNSFLDDYYADLTKKKCIILPSLQQDYRDEYFRMIFPKAVEILRRAKVLIFIGTSLPDEDYLFKHLLSHYFDEETDIYTKMIVYIGYAKKKKEQDRIKERVLKVFPQLSRNKERLFFWFDGLVKFIEEYRTYHIKTKHPRESLQDYWRWDDDTKEIQELL